MSFSKLTISRVSVWQNGASRIRSQYFFKQMVNIGSDKSCDIRKGFTHALVGVLNFKTGRLQRLIDDTNVEIAPGQIIELDGQVLAYDRYNLLSSKWIWGVGAIGMILAILFFVPARSKEHRDCQKISAVLFSSRPQSKSLIEISKKAKNFRSSIRRLNMLEASAWVSNIRSSLSQHPEWKNCNLDSEFLALENQVLELRFLEAIDSSDYELAMNQWEQLQQQSRYQISPLLQREVLKRGRDLAWKAWKLESRDPLFSREAKIFLDEFCESLQKEADCFLPILRNKSRPSVAKQGEAYSNLAAPRP